MKNKASLIRASRPPPSLAPLYHPHLLVVLSLEAKVEEVGLPPGWEAGGNSAPVVFRQREWVAGAGGGVRPPTTGWALGRDSGAWSPAQLLTPDIGLTPSILPGGCGKWSYSAVPRT